MDPGLEGRVAVVTGGASNRAGRPAGCWRTGLIIPEAAEIGEGSLWQQGTGFGEREIAAIEKAISLRRRPCAEDVGAAVAFSASDRAAQLTGQTLCVSGGFSMPR